MTSLEQLQKSIADYSMTLDRERYWIAAQFVCVAISLACVAILVMAGG